MAKQNLAELAKKAEAITGFGAVVDLGRKLKPEEVDIILDYCEARGADKEKVKSVLEERGRPYDIADATFSTKCYICRALRNYCCC